jgi:hypothetical protein
MAGDNSPEQPAASQPPWARSELARAIERANTLADREHEMADAERARAEADNERAAEAAPRGRAAHAAAARTHARAARLHDDAAALQALHRDHLLDWWQTYQASAVAPVPGEADAAPATPAPPR